MGEYNEILASQSQSEAFRDSEHWKRASRIRLQFFNKELGLGASRGTYELSQLLINAINLNST